MKGTKVQTLGARTVAGAWCMAGRLIAYYDLVSQASRIFPRAHARGKGGGGREGKIRLVRCAGFSFQSGM